MKKALLLAFLLGSLSSVRADSFILMEVLQDNASYHLRAEVAGIDPALNIKFLIDDVLILPGQAGLTDLQSGLMIFDGLLPTLGPLFAEGVHHITTTYTFDGGPVAGPESFFSVAPYTLVNVPDTTNSALLLGASLAVIALASRRLKLSL
jgi:hypothetical protein